MNSPRMVAGTRWVLAFVALAGIVLVFRRWLHVNPTTVALSMLLLILVIAAHWSLRYAVAVSVVATALYNFYFLPPVGGNRVRIGAAEQGLIFDTSLPGRGLGFSPSCRWPRPKSGMG